MKLTPARVRMLCVLSDGQARQVWKLCMESGSHASGYRTIAALYAGGLIAATSSHTDPFYAITEAGRSAIRGK